MKCRFCGSDNIRIFADLDTAPPSNSYLNEEDLAKDEPKYPLKVNICENCLLVQAEEYKKHEDIFNNEYLYFSSYSESWLKHSKDYVEMIAERRSLNKSSFVIEIASNDGYLLQYFKQKDIPCMGIEPTRSTASVALEKGIPTEIEFWTTKFAEFVSEKYGKADLILGNNVLAHTPYINDFVEGVYSALKPDGICTFEFPHIYNLIEMNQFDTIYHEHFSYFSLYVVSAIFEKHGLYVYDAEELKTHGGSLRIYASPQNKDRRDGFKKILKKENDKNLHNIEGYKDFNIKIEKVKNDFAEFIISENKKGKKIAAYGAAAKGNTLLNYAGIDNTLIKFVVDKSPFKQGKFMPGSKIPIVAEERLREEKPDLIVIFPWNLKDEIMSQLAYVKNWNARFVTAVPELKII